MITENRFPREAYARLQRFGFSVSSDEQSRALKRIDKWDQAFSKSPRDYLTVPEPIDELEKKVDALVILAITLLISELCAFSHEQVIRSDPAVLPIIQKYKVSPRITTKVLFSFRELSGAGAGLAAAHSTYASTGVIKEPYWLLFYNCAGDGLDVTQKVHPGSLAGQAVTAYHAAVKAKEVASQGKKIGAWVKRPTPRNTANVIDR